MTLTRVSAKMSKVLETQNEYTRSQSFDLSTLVVDNGVVNWDLDNNQSASVNLTANVTIALPTNMREGANYVLTVKQDVAGERTITWNSAFQWERDITPVHSQDPDTITVFVFLCYNNKMYGQRFWSEEG